MKKTLLFLSTSFVSLGFAQKISVSESSEKFSTGSQNAAVTTIYEAKLDDVIKEWKKVLKDLKYEKVKEDDNEVFGDNILIKDWGNNPVDFYTKFEENKKARTIKMSTAVDLGGAYLRSNDNSDKFKYIENMSKDFALKMSKAPIEEQLKEAKEELEKQENKLKDLERKKTELQDDIVNYNSKKAKAEKELITKEAEIKKKKAEVEVQKKVVDASAGAVSEQAKSSQKIYDKLNDQLKDLEKEQKDLKNDIEDYSKKTERAEKDIKENESDQEKKKKEIEEAKKKRDEVEKKLYSIN